MPFGTPGTHPLDPRDASEEVLLGLKTEDPKKHKVAKKNMLQAFLVVQFLQRPGQRALVCWRGSKHRLLPMSRLALVRRPLRASTTLPVISRLNSRVAGQWLAKMGRQTAPFRMKRDFIRKLAFPSSILAHEKHNFVCC